MADANGETELQKLIGRVAALEADAEATGGAAHGLSGAFAGAADVGGKSVAIVVRRDATVL